MVSDFIKNLFADKVFRRVCTNQTFVIVLNGIEYALYLDRRHYIDETYKDFLIYTEYHYFGRAQAIGMIEITKEETEFILKKVKDKQEQQNKKFVSTIENLTVR